MRIYCDLDGVLVDFVSAALRSHHYNPEHVFARWPVGEWSITSILGMKASEFWNPLNTKYFWKSLEWYPWGKDLLATLKKYDVNTTILTAPSASYNSNLGKTQWAEANGICNRNGMIIRANKWEFAQRDTILIDDSERNCNLWKAEGGISILFPQIWNSHGHTLTSPSEKLNFIQQQLESLT